MVSRQATAIIDLEALAHNFEVVRELAPGARIMAVLKADAYGHGAEKVAQKLAQADAFGVARVNEAVRLREAGIGQPICILEGVADKEELNLASIYELQCVVHSDYQVALLESAGARRPVWLKVDTGMSRLGFSPDETAAVIPKLVHQKLQGLMTHLADAGDPRSLVTSRQLERLSTLQKSLRHPVAKTLCIANSGGVLTRPDTHADWVRPGIMLYGATPMDDLEPVMALQPVMTFTAPVISVHAVRQGESVGYGGIWTADRDCRVAVIAAGYADGYPREIEQGAPVMLGESHRPLVGRVSMDMLCVRLDDADRVRPGDQAILWGPGLPVETVARHAGTIAYTLLCGVSGRVTRAYRGVRRRG